MEIEESLIESEKKFRHLSEEIADGVAVTINGKIKWVNMVFPKIFGFEYDELSDMGIDTLIQSVETPDKIVPIEGFVLFRAEPRRGFSFLCDLRLNHRVRGHRFQKIR